MGSQESECQPAMVVKEHKLNNDDKEKKVNNATTTTTDTPICSAEALSSSSDKDNCVSNDAPLHEASKPKDNIDRSKERKSRRKKAEPKRRTSASKEETNRKSTREKDSKPRKPRKQRSSRGFVEEEEEGEMEEDTQQNDEESPPNSDEPLGDNSAEGRILKRDQASQILKETGRVRRIKSVSLGEVSPKPSGANLRRAATAADRVSRKSRVKPPLIVEEEGEASKPKAATSRTSRKPRIKAAASSADDTMEEREEEATKPAADPLRRAATTTGRISRKSRIKAAASAEEEEEPTTPSTAAPLQRATTTTNGRISRKSRIRAAEEEDAPRPVAANPLRRAATSTGMAARRPIRRAFSNKESIAAMSMGRRPLTRASTNDDDIFAMARSVQVRRPLKRASTNDDDIFAMARSARSSRLRRANSGMETIAASMARQRSARSLFLMEEEEEEEEPVAAAPFGRSATSSSIASRTLLQQNRWGEATAAATVPTNAPFQRAATNTNIASSRLRNKLAMLKEEAASSAMKQSADTKSLASFGDLSSVASTTTTRRRLGGRASSDKELNVNSLMAPGGEPRRGSSNKDLVAMARLAGTLAGTSDNMGHATTRPKSTRKTPMRSSSSGSILESALTKIPWGRSSSGRQLSDVHPTSDASVSLASKISAQTWVANLKEDSPRTVLCIDSKDLKTEEKDLATMLASETRQARREDGTMSVVSESFAAVSRKSQPIKATSRRQISDLASENENKSLEQKLASGTRKARREDGTRSVVSESLATKSRKFHATRASSRRELLDHSSGSENNSLGKKLNSSTRQTRREDGTMSVVSESLATESWKSQPVRASSRRQLSVVSSGTENNSLEKKLAPGTRQTRKKDCTMSVVSESFATESRKSRPSRVSSRRQLSDSSGNENITLQKELASGTSSGAKREDGRRSVVSESQATSRKSKPGRASSRRQLSDLPTGNERRASSRRQLSDSPGNGNKNSAISQSKGASAADTGRRKRPRRAASESFLLSSGLDPKTREGKGKNPSKSKAGRKPSARSPMRGSKRLSTRHLSRARSSGELLDDDTMKSSRPGRDLRRSPSAGHVLDDKKPGRRKKATISPLPNGKIRRSSSSGSLTLLSDSSGEAEAGGRKKHAKLKRVQSAGQDLFDDSRATRSYSLTLLSDSSDEEENNGRKNKRGLRRAQSTGTDLFADGSRADKQRQIRGQGRKNRPMEGRRHERRQQTSRSPMRPSTGELSSNKNKSTSSVKPRVNRGGNRQRKTPAEQLISSIDDSTRTPDSWGSMDDSTNVWHQSDPMLGDWAAADSDSDSDEDGQGYLPGQLGSKHPSAPNFLDGSIADASKSGRRGSALWKAAQTSAQRMLDWPTPKVSKDKLSFSARDTEGGMEGSFRASVLSVSNAFGTMLASRNERSSPNTAEEEKGKEAAKKPNNINWFKEQVDVSKLHELEVQSRLPMGNAPPSC